MKISTSGIVLSALFMALSGAAHAESLATITFLGAPTGANDGSYFVLPYQISIQEGSNEPVIQNVICYDTHDEVSYGETWSADLLSLNEAVTSGYFSNTADPLLGYEEVAWLSGQSYTDTDSAVALQHAIWDVFGTAPADQNSNQDNDLAAYEAALTAAIPTFTTSEFSNTVFVEEVPPAEPGGDGTAQAFVFGVLGNGNNGNFGLPEPSTPILAGSGLVLLALGRLRSKFSSRRA